MKKKNKKRHQNWYTVKMPVNLLKKIFFMVMFLYSILMFQHKKKKLKKNKKDKEN